MRKLFIASLLFTSVSFKALADEGMWLPLLLGPQVYNDMVKKGLKLTKEQLFSLNKPSLKDAIVIFNGGCTGEVVSPQGLIFTNHHCGYGVIAGASTIEHNHLKNGFYAKSLAEEIPGNTQGLYVEFLTKIEDVTRLVLDSLQGLSGQERSTRQSEIINAINTRMSNREKHIRASVGSLFKGNQFLLFVYTRYPDVRLVGTPPEALGKFGGDTDNWEWPRHTVDYSVFRVYGASDGSPADYDVNNKPLKPKWYLPVSLKGIKEGDFSLIYGYPGSTNRYESSLGVQYSTDIHNPTLVKLRDMRLKYMFEEMKKDPATKLQLASRYASVANYWKFYKGETEQLLKYDVYGQKKKQEDAFIKWAQGKPGYQNIFNDLKASYDAWRPYAMHRMYINEGILGSPLLAFASSLQDVETALTKPGTSTDAIQRAVAAGNRARQNFLKSENKTSDQNIIAAVLQMYYNDIPKEQQPQGLYEAIKNEYGALDKASTYQKYAEAIVKNTMIFDDKKWNDFVQRPNANLLQQDLAYNLASTIVRNYNGRYLPLYQQFTTKNNEWGRLYLKGIMEMNPNKFMYPDATSTMRLSYGKVASYKPRDAVQYDYVTTMTGMLAKYIPGDHEFDLPQDFLKAAKAKDFGPYKDPKKNDLIIGFITTDDITGGNSGSPVINANGELIGLAFDGNYEALSHKLAFDKDLNRTICVDIRAVLWCIDKLGGAQNLIKELTLKK